MKPIAMLEKEIIAEFQALADVDDKYAHLFSLGDQLPELNPAYKTEAYRVKGCESTVWFHLRPEGGRLYLEADSDSMVIKGITALLVRLVAGRHPQELQALSMDFLDQIQVWKLPSQRNSGLQAMLAHILQQAQELSSDDLVRTQGEST